MRRLPTRSTVVVAFSLCVSALTFITIHKQNTNAQRRNLATSRLKQIGLALHQYNDNLHWLPAASHGADTTRGCSWHTALLPYLGHEATFATIDHNVPWSQGKQNPAFQQSIPQYINPTEPMPRLASGLAATHFAVNSHVFTPNKHLKFYYIADGCSTTIAAGEVSAGLRAWGDPDNARDPILGVDPSRTTFGRSDKTGAQFLFLDGSVRFLTPQTDAEIFDRYATPNGNDYGPCELPRDP